VLALPGRLPAGEAADQLRAGIGLLRGQHGGEPGQGTPHGLAVIHHVSDRLAGRISERRSRGRRPRGGPADYEADAT
jgi:hypothetical protein